MSDQSKTYLQQLLGLYRRFIVPGGASGPDSISVTTASSALPTGASTAANQTTEITSLQIMDDWDESDRAKVNTIVGQAGVQAGYGAVTANTQRITFATDSDLPPGENHIGAVGGNTVLVASTLTLSVGGAAATGDYVGTSTTPQLFTNALRTAAGTGIIKSIKITDKLTTAAVNLELWLFYTTFVAPTDNAAWAISDAELLTCVAVIPISSSKWYASANNKVFFDDTLAAVVEGSTVSLQSGRDLYYALVARGTTPAWATGDLTVTLGILQD